MSPLLAPVLAQLVTLGVSDRLDARMLDVGNVGQGQTALTYGRYQPGGRYFEASNTASAGLNLAWKRVNWFIGYSPTLLLPLSDDLKLVMFHTAQTAINWNRRIGRDAFSASQSFTAAQRDFRRDLIAPPVGFELPAEPDVNVPVPPENGAPGGAPVTGNAGTPSAGAGTAATAQTPSGQLARDSTPDLVRYGTSNSSLGYTRFVTRTTTFDARFDYAVSGGLDDDSRVVYPLTHGPRLSLSLNHRMSRRDLLFERFTSQYLFTRGDNWAWLSLATVGWSHSFTREITVALDVGVAVSWYTLGDGRVILQIFPIAGTGAGSQLGVNYKDRVAGGILLFRIAGSVSPYVNMTANADGTPVVTVDPRLGLVSDVSWRRKKLSLGANVSSAFAITTEPKRALNGVSFGVNAAYALGAGFSADAGLSGGWQVFGEKTVVPPTYTAWVGVSWATILPLN